MVSEKFNTDILYTCIYCINVYIVICIIVIHIPPTTKEKHGIFCQNEAHMGSYNNVSVSELQCLPCTEYGAPIKSTNDVYSIPPLSPLSTTVPVLLLALVSRSSSGASIKKKTFKHLQQFIVDHKQ